MTNQLITVINQAIDDLLQYQDGGMDEIIDVVIADLTAGIDAGGGQQSQNQRQHKGMQKEQISVAKACDRKSVENIYTMCLDKTNALNGDTAYIYQSMLFCAGSIIKRAGQIASADNNLDGSKARRLISRLAKLYTAEFMAEITRRI